MPAHVRLCLLTLALASCREGTSPGPQAEAEPATIRVTQDRQDLVYSYLDETGAFQTADSVADVPEAARRSVVVTDLSLSPEARQAGRYVYVADLTTPRDDGSYPVAIASRHAFEASQAGVGTDGSSEGVVVYTTAWCGVCKKAKRLLREWNVPFEEKDVEASKQAQAELSAKAQAAGAQATGVPVIDVAGTLLMGLDEQTLRQALESKGLLRRAP